MASTNGLARVGSLALLNWNWYSVASWYGPHEKETGCLGIPVAPLAGLRIAAPREVALTGRPALTVNDFGVDPRLLITCPVTASLVLNL